MAVAAISASPSFLGASCHFSIAGTRRGANPRLGALVATGGSWSTSSASVVLRAASGRGSSSSRRYDDVDPFLEEGEEVGGLSSAPLRCCFCGHCGRRGLLGGLSSTSLAPLFCGPSGAAEDGGSPILPAEERGVAVPASRPGWYKELYAWVTEHWAESYEAEVRSPLCFAFSFYNPIGIR